MELYQKIFIEHFGSASLIPLYSRMMLAVMEEFGGYEMDKAALVGIAGLIAGGVFNWAIGWLLALLRSRVAFLGNNEFERVSEEMQRYGFILAALFWIPLGSILVLLTGFFRVALWKVILMLALSSAWMLHPYLM